MPPRGFTNPPPKTDSARAALSSFYCNLCSKGYSRMPDYEAHLSSYDHSHRARLKDMKALTRDTGAAERQRREENKGSGLIQIKLGGDKDSGVKKGGFKKGGFKSAFAPMVSEEEKKPDSVKPDGKSAKLGAGEESDTDEERYERYDPEFPTE